MIPLFIRGVDNIIHRRLRFGYDVGKGFVMGEEEMLQQFDRFGGLVHKKIALELRRRAEETRLDVIKSLGMYMYVGSWGVVPVATWLCQASLIVRISYPQTLHITQQ